MNSRKLEEDEETSFEGLVAFDTVPPPHGEGPDDLRSDVHSACTAVAALPDSFLEELKSGVKADVSRLALGRKSLSASPLIPREEPDDRSPASDLVATRKAHAFELPEPPTSPYGSKILGGEAMADDLARAMGSALTAAPARRAPPAAPPSVRPHVEPYVPAPSYRPSPPPAMPSFDAPLPLSSARPEWSSVSTPPPVVTTTAPATVRRSFVERFNAGLQTIYVRVSLIAVAVGITCAIVLALMARLMRHLD